MRESNPTQLKPCRDCQREVSTNAYMCPHCGAPRPTQPNWDGWGFEYKSQTHIAGLPLLHISFKYRPNRMPVPAKGIIAIGQFGAGVINISQFGVGLVSLGQFSIGGLVISQFALGMKIIAQFGVYIESGYGQVVWPLQSLFGF